MSLPIAIAAACLVAWLLRLFVIDVGYFTSPAEGATLKAVDKSGLAPISRKSSVLAPTPDGPLITRCMALPGDTFELRDAHVFINGKPNVETHYAIASFHLLKDVPYASRRRMAQEAGISIQQADSLLRLSTVSQATQWNRATYAIPRPNEQDQRVFPWDVAFQWNAYQMGPFRLPKKGDRIPLDYENVRLYGKLVGKYEGRHLDVTPLASYVFNEDYAMCLNDDRDIINDSRLYGPMPLRMLRRTFDE